MEEEKANTTASKEKEKEQPSLLQQTKSNQGNSFQQSQNQDSTFHRSCQIELRQPVGSMSLSPANRDVILAARSGLFILDLERPYDQPRFVANLTSWEVADIQWNPHPSRSKWVASTSNQKLLVWNLDRPTSFRTPSTKLPPPAKPGTFSYGNTTVTSGLSASPSLNGNVRSFNSSNTNKNQFGTSFNSSLRKQSQSPFQTFSQSQRSSQIYSSSSHAHNHIPRSSGTANDPNSIQDSQLSLPPPESLHGAGGASVSNSSGNNSAIEFVLPVHTRAITDINWSAFHPDVLASCSLDTWTWVWDLRTPRKPVQGYSAWNAAMTSVKWNRASPHRMATSCDNKVQIWDSRKGSLPLASIEAHESRIYGIDWSRDVALGLDRLVTCSLDTTVKYWDLSTESSMKAIGSRQLVTEPELTISTNTPVWRARNLPFGEGVMTLPQRGDNGLSLWNKNKPGRPVKRFEGHNDTVKEFLWRTKGGEQKESDDRRFQLLTWSKDQVLRMWPVSEEDMKAVDHVPNAPIRVLHTRAHAPDISYREPPSLTIGGTSNNTTNQNSQGPTPTHTRPGSTLPSNVVTPLSGTSLLPTNGKNIKAQRPGYDLNNQGLGSGSSSEDRNGGSLAQLSQSLGTRRSKFGDESGSNSERGRDSAASSSYVHPSRNQVLLGSSLPRSHGNDLRMRLDGAFPSNSERYSRFGGGFGTEGKEREREKGQEMEKNSEDPKKSRKSSSRRKTEKLSSNKARSSARNNGNGSNVGGGYMTRGTGQGGLPLTLGLGLGSGMGSGTGAGTRYGGVGREALGWIEGVRMLEGEEEISTLKLKTQEPVAGAKSENGESTRVESEMGDRESDEDGEEVEEGGAQGLGKELFTTAKEWPRAMFEKVEVSQRRCTISLYGPWATSNVLPHPVFIRISFRFPSKYPSQPARFELERTANVSLKTRAFLLRKLAKIVTERASRSKGCLASCISFLFGEDLLQHGLGLASIPLDAGRRLEELEREKDQVEKERAERNGAGFTEDVEGGGQLYGPHAKRHTLMLGQVGMSDDEEAGVGARPLLLPPPRCGASFSQHGLLVVFRTQPQVTFESEIGTETEASHSGFSIPAAMTFQKLAALNPPPTISSKSEVSPSLSATIEDEINSDFYPKDTLSLPPPVLNPAGLRNETHNIQNGRRIGQRSTSTSRGGGKRFLKSYSALADAMGKLARLNPDPTSSEMTSKDVQDSDVLLLMSSDFVRRRMKTRSSSRVRAGKRSQSSVGRRNASVVRGHGNGSGSNTPFGLEYAQDGDAHFSEVKIYDAAHLLEVEREN